MDDGVGHGRAEEGTWWIRDSWLALLFHHLERQLTWFHLCKELDFRWEAEQQEDCARCKGSTGIRSFSVFLYFLNGVDEHWCGFGTAHPTLRHLYIDCLKWRESIWRRGNWYEVDVHCCLSASCTPAWMAFIALPTLQVREVEDGTTRSLDCPTPSFGAVFQKAAGHGVHRWLQNHQSTGALPGLGLCPRCACNSWSSRSSAWFFAHAKKCFVQRGANMQPLFFKCHC